MTEIDKIDNHKNAINYNRLLSILIKYQKYQFVTSYLPPLPHPPPSRKEKVRLLKRQPPTWKSVLPSLCLWAKDLMPKQVEI